MYLTSTLLGLGFDDDEVPFSHRTVPTSNIKNNETVLT